MEVQDFRYGVGIGVLVQGRRGLRDAAESPTPAPLEAEQNFIFTVVPVVLGIVVFIGVCICCCYIRRRYEGSGMNLADQKEGQTELTFSLAVVQEEERCHAEQMLTVYKSCTSTQL